jgi:hypothetical protein
MSLTLLAEALVKMEGRLAKVEDTVDIIAQRCEQMLEYVGEPKGELSFRTRHRPSPRELRRVFKDEAEMEEECAELGATFSYAMYLGLVPENGEKIRELLAPTQIQHLRSVLACYKKLNEVTGWAEEARKKADEAFENKKLEIQRSIELNILKGSNNVVNQLHEAQRRLKVQEDRIDVAIGQLDKALVASVDATAKAKNVVVSNTRPGRNKFSIGRSNG